jgi:hypothetical protein
VALNQTRQLGAGIEKDGPRPFPGGLGLGRVGRGRGPRRTLFLRANGGGESTYGGSTALSLISRSEIAWGSAGAPGAMGEAPAALNPSPGGVVLTNIPGRGD